ncbi:MAG: heme lyase NrfEFG subunit NrfE [Oleiphilus sp.]|nr:MAG: heme lyase NrfEFG subunit NrfE [Oleiphilus sp.]
MIPELGLFALILGLVLASVQSVLPMWGSYRGNVVFMSTARSLAVGQFTLVALSFACLTLSFLNDDFSVKYVANHSNTLLPVAFKFSAVWGGHEGSLLLWALILSSWTIAVALFSRQLPLVMLARVLSVMGLISVGFLLFILLTSSPFERYLPNFPHEGADLNPLLQDFGLIVHPPMLYMGYVGFSVAFAFAIAALLGGRLDAAWARWSRPWTTIAWVFLTIGIALGSWWAYYELGWGGWWFWDPVENASFMPWLVGTALMHSLAVTEKRGSFKGWTVLLAIIAFSLSLLGTFLVRSGVLTSVHAFASDPERGQFVLGLLGITMVCSLVLYAIRAPDMRSHAEHGLLSRESFLLVNNVLLVCAWVTVMLGTLYPLVLDFIGASKLSIGPPYFNALFVPLMSALAVVMGFGVLGRWKSTPGRELINKLRWVALIAVIAALLVPYLLLGHFKFGVFLGVFLSLWIVLVGLQDIRDKTRNSANLWAGLKKLRPAYFGMQFGHLGFAVAIAGVALVSLEAEERDIRMGPGDQALVSGYLFDFKTLESVRGPNYRSRQAIFEVSRNGEHVAILKPEKRTYFSQDNPMTEAGIDPGLFRDIYVALGEPLEGDVWAVRIQYKPFVRWIWLGALLMGFGGILAVSDKRYRLARRQSAISGNEAGASV